MQTKLIAAQRIALATYFEQPRTSDTMIRSLALTLFPASLVATLIGMGFPSLSIIPPLILLGFCVTYLRIRTRLNDLVLAEGIVMVLYSLTPHFGSASSQPLTLAYGVEGGFNLHNIAITAYFLAVWISFRFIPVAVPNMEARSGFRVAGINFAASAGAIVSIMLSIIYLYRFGFVLGGDVDYSETFMLRQTSQSGYGLLLLSVPLALSSLALALSRNKRVFSLAMIMPLMSFLFLLVVHGQRKYFIIPLLFIGVTRIRARRLPAILVAVGGMAFTWCAFCYLGFLRVENIKITQAFDQQSISKFLDESDEYLAGETISLTGSGSASVEGAIAPLPHFGDYLDVWQMMVPQFLIHSTYEPINVRFAYIWNARTAKKGMGWGFDFWGEAYTAGGPIMVLIVAIAMTAIFRFLHIQSLKNMGTGFWGAYAIMGSYYALWFQRNGFAYFCREYLVLSSFALLLLIWLSYLMFMLTLSSTRRGDSGAFARRPRRNATPSLRNGLVER